MDKCTFDSGKLDVEVWFSIVMVLISSWEAQFPVFLKKEVLCCFGILSGGMEVVP